MVALGQPPAWLAALLLVSFGLTASGIVTAIAVWLYSRFVERRDRFV